LAAQRGLTGQDNSEHSQRESLSKTPDCLLTQRKEWGGGQCLRELNFYLQLRGGERKDAADTAELQVRFKNRGDQTQEEKKKPDKTGNHDRIAEKKWILQ